MIGREGGDHDRAKPKGLAHVVGTSILELDLLLGLYLKLKRRFATPQICCPSRALKEDFAALGVRGSHFLDGFLTAVANSLGLWHICDRKTPRSVLLFQIPLRF